MYLLWNLSTLFYSNPIFPPVCLARPLSRAVAALFGLPGGPVSSIDSDGEIRRLRDDIPICTSADELFLWLVWLQCCPPLQTAFIASARWLP